MKKTTFLFVLCLSLFACENNNSEEAATDEAPTTAVPNNAPQIEKIKELMTNKDLLQGKWESTEDSKSVIIFEGSTKKDVYDGEGMEAEEFTVSDKCENEDMGLDPTEDRYLTVGDMCYYIIEVNATDLELSYVGRGNTLAYKKVD